MEAQRNEVHQAADQPISPAQARKHEGTDEEPGCLGDKHAVGRPAIARDPPGDLHEQECPGSPSVRAVIVEVEHRDRPLVVDHEDRDGGIGIEVDGVDVAGRTECPDGSPEEVRPAGENRDQEQGLAGPGPFER